MKPWTYSDIPDQSGRTAIVTGANTGIGFEAARMLALKVRPRRARVPQPREGEGVLERILAERASASVSLEALDLSDLNSVAAFADAFTHCARAPGLARQQRGRDGAAARAHEAGLRAAVRHQPSRTLRSGGCAATADFAHAGSADRGRRQRRKSLAISNSMT